MHTCDVIGNDFCILTSLLGRMEIGRLLGQVSAKAVLRGAAVWTDGSPYNWWGHSQARGWPWRVGGAHRPGTHTENSRAVSPSGSAPGAAARGEDSQITSSFHQEPA